MPLFHALIASEVSFADLAKHADAEQISTGVIPLVAALEYDKKVFTFPYVQVMPLEGSKKYVIWATEALALGTECDRRSVDTPSKLDKIERSLTKSKAYFGSISAGGNALPRATFKASVRIRPINCELSVASVTHQDEATEYSNWVNENGLWLEDRAELAESTATADWKLARLAFEPNSSVRMSVAMNSQTSPETLSMLVQNSHRASNSYASLAEVENPAWWPFNPEANFESFLPWDIQESINNEWDQQIAEAAAAELTRRGLRPPMPAYEARSLALSPDDGIPENGEKDALLEAFQEWMREFGFVRYVGSGDEKELDGIDPQLIWTEELDGNGDFVHPRFSPPAGANPLYPQGYYVMSRPRVSGSANEDSVQTSFWESCPDCDFDNPDCPECEGDGQVLIDLADLNLSLTKQSNELPSSDGEAAKAVFCPACGTKFKEDAVFCASCGSLR